MSAPPAFLDGMYRQIRSTSPNMVVPWFLMASFVYYCADDALVTDALYDEMCQDLAARWDHIEHRDKYLVEQASLSGGTGFYLDVADYPLMIRQAAAILMRGDPIRRELPAELLGLDPVRPPRRERPRAAIPAPAPAPPPPVPEAPAPAAWLSPTPPAAPVVKPVQASLF